MQIDWIVKCLKKAVGPWITAYGYLSVRFKIYMSQNAEFIIRIRITTQTTQNQNNFL